VSPLSIHHDIELAAEVRNLKKIYIEERIIQNGYQTERTTKRGTQPDAKEHRKPWVQQEVILVRSARESVPLQTEWMPVYRLCVIPAARFADTHSMPNNTSKMTPRENREKREQRKEKGEEIILQKRGQAKMFSR